MEGLALINGESGTLKTCDMASLESHVRSEFEKAGHRVTIIRIDQTGMADALEQARASQAELLIAAGGDGTVSALAELAWRTNRLLGVLPGGTMNLYASTLRSPADIFEAVSALAKGREVLADIATANGEPFINQYSVGFHPRAVKLRNKMDYASRLGKITATLRAMFSVITDPPSFPAHFTVNATKPHTERITALSVSNNLLGAGHNLFADTYNGHCLGVYRTPKVNPLEAVKLILDLIVGTWTENRNVTIEETQKMSVSFPRKRKNSSALKDGELVDLPSRVDFKIEKDALRVLLPHTGVAQ
uniref:diacylglycerol/lipid kinase family protein n=1 Tax=Pararhizobium sp. IMCC3301 TaxID=3067904 RepID=UPI002740479B|nr:diacylglycerol kinase family protein [Pararhizobium sp. IMCC3301]